MEKQRGFKRAAKVAARKRKLVEHSKVAALRRIERQAELAEKEKAEKAKAK